jgi:hypothetical protein
VALTLVFAGLERHSILSALRAQRAGRRPGTSQSGDTASGARSRKGSR